MLAVITGASSGLGATFARKLAARGYDLLLVARREDRLRGLAREIGEQYKIRAEALVADLSEEDEVTSLAARMRDASDLGLLVNNAGFGTMGYFYETDPAGQDRMYRLHVLATERLTHAALANWVPRKVAGGVINVSSVAAYGMTPQNVSYCSTKTWMSKFTEGLAIELAALQTPVVVQALCPGFILTEFHDTLGMDRSPIPAWMWMTSDFVVDESLKGFDQKKLFVIPGWRYKLLVAFLSVIPGRLQRWGSIRAVQRYRMKKER